jgi:hypothetical protein
MPYFQKGFFLFPHSTNCSGTKNGGLLVSCKQEIWFCPLTRSVGNKPFYAHREGLPDLFGKMYQTTRKIYKMVIKYTNIVRTKVVRNIPKLRFSEWKYTMLHTCSRIYTGEWVYIEKVTWGIIHLGQTNSLWETAEYLLSICWLISTNQDFSD